MLLRQLQACPQLLAQPRPVGKGDAQLLRLSGKDSLQHGYDGRVRERIKFPCCSGLRPALIYDAIPTLRSSSSSCRARSPLSTNALSCESLCMFSHHSPANETPRREAPTMRTPQVPKTSLKLRKAPVTPAFCPTPNSGGSGLYKIRTRQRLSDTFRCCSCHNTCLDINWAWSPWRFLKAKRTSVS